MIDARLEELLTQKTSITTEDIKECGVKSSKTISRILQDMKTKGIIVEQNEETQIRCNKCPSIQIISSYNCIACKKSRFEKRAYIEHYNCGKVLPQQEYHNDKCPSCKNELKALGVDHGILNNFICLDCDCRFQEPLVIN